MTDDTFQIVTPTRFLPAWRPLAGAVLLVVAFLAAWGPCDHLILTGRLFPVDKIEVLQSPRQVLNWTAEALILADGGRLRLPGMTKLPQASNALGTAVARGVEVAPDGQVYGLLQIHHWCGNDPVRHHLARINLVRLLQFLGEGEPNCDLANTMFRGPILFDHSEFGWNVSGYLQFRLFEEQLESTSMPQGAR